MRARKSYTIFFRSLAIFSVISWTSSWDGTDPPIPAPMLVTQDIPRTCIPICFAAMVSMAVLIPTAFRIIGHGPTPAVEMIYQSLRATNTMRIAAKAMIAIVAAPMTTAS